MAFHVLKAAAIYLIYKYSGWHLGYSQDSTLVSGTHETMIYTDMEMHSACLKTKQWKPADSPRYMCSVPLGAIDTDM